MRVSITRVAGLAVAAGLAAAMLTPDAQRSARLVFADELRAGLVLERDLDRPEVGRALATRPVPPAPVRQLQRLAMKRGVFDFERRNLGPLDAARRAVLGPAAAGPPRFLVRVDEFPLAGAYEPSARRDADFARFHSILTEAGVPYLVAVSPGVARDYLDPSGTETRPLSDGSWRHSRTCAATASPSRCTGSTTAPTTRAPATAPSWSAWTTTRSASCSISAPSGWPRPASARACSRRPSTASRRTSTRRSRGATT